MSITTSDIEKYREPDCDVSRADPALVATLRAYFAAKNAKRVDETVACFSPTMTTYTDATLGWALDGTDALRGTFARYMPGWGEGRSYPVRIVGGPTSAVVIFTDTPELFGGELHLVGAVDLVDGRIVRWLDYWDGAEFDRATFDRISTPEADYPDPRQRVVPVTAEAPMVEVATALQRALADRAIGDAAALLSYDCVWEDRALRLQIVGAAPIAAYLERAIDLLPFGPGASLLHIVGGGRGGGFEWIAAPDATVRVGICALDLDAQGAITRVVFCYDGTRITDEAKRKLWEASHPN